MRAQNRSDLSVHHTNRGPLSLHITIEVARLKLSDDLIKFEGLTHFIRSTYQIVDISLELVHRFFVILWNLL